MKWLGLFLTSVTMGVFLAALAQAAVPTLTMPMLGVVALAGGLVILVVMARLALIAETIEVHDGKIWDGGKLK